MHPGLSKYIHSRLYFASCNLCGAWHDPMQDVGIMLYRLHAEFKVSLAVLPGYSKFVPHGVLHCYNQNSVSGMCCAVCGRVCCNAINKTVCLCWHMLRCLWYRYLGVSAAQKAAHEPEHFKCKVKLGFGINDHPRWCELTRNTNSKALVGGVLPVPATGQTLHLGKSYKMIFPRMLALHTC